MLTRHEMTIVPERMINIDWGAGGNLANVIFLSCGATFIKKMPKFCRVCHEFCNRLSEMVRGGSDEKYSVYRFGILTSDVVSLFASFHTISGAIH